MPCSVLIAVEPTGSASLRIRLNFATAKTARIQEARGTALRYGYKNLAEVLTPSLSPSKREISASEPTHSEVDTLEYLSACEDTSHELDPSSPVVL